MIELTYQIQLFSQWHCGSGLSAGADVDAMVIRDEHGLPYIPGKTIKGLLRDAGETLCELGHAKPEMVNAVFGRRSGSNGSAPDCSEAGSCFFANAELSKFFAGQLAKNPELVDLLFRSHSATAIDACGQAVEHSLRRTETVIPLTLCGYIAAVPDQAADFLERCMKLTKRLGVNRNRGLGRCDMSLLPEVAK